MHYQSLFLAIASLITVTTAQVDLTQHQSDAKTIVVYEVVEDPLANGLVMSCGGLGNGGVTHFSVGILSLQGLRCAPFGPGLTNFLCRATDESQVDRTIKTGKELCDGAKPVSGPETLFKSERVSRLAIDSLLDKAGL